jgi:hypothetical protein
MNAGRPEVVDHLVARWLGPADGEHETLDRSPVYAYLVGALYPAETGPPEGSVTFVEEIDAEDASAIIHDEDDAEDDPNEEASDNDNDIDHLVGAFGWAPSSLGMSFVRDSVDLHVRVTAGVYAELEAEDSDEDGDRRPGKQWRRRSVEDTAVVPPSGSGRIPVLDGRAHLSWRDRRVGGRTLTTISISNSATCGPGAAKRHPEDCLFQVELRCEIVGGVFHPYPQGDALDASKEELQLQLRYRDRSVFAIGHGTATSWGDRLAPTSVWTESIPTEVVPAVRARKSESQYLELRVLADEATDTASLVDGLRQIAVGYAGWLTGQEETLESLTAGYKGPGLDLVDQQRRMLERLNEGIDLIRDDEVVRTSFRLANSAMRRQMLQQSLTRNHPGRLGEELVAVPSDALEPRWHPFQLGFILTALASSSDPGHADRDLVDLIWFPTGGGKTEAYLGLAAIEMIRRRLRLGRRGGGTAVITRYTMRLLTAQQFQRAATLMCALELLRSGDQRLSATAPFTIGLWLGNSTTPGTYKQAHDQRRALLRDAVPGNPFQVRQCPWCATSILPARRASKEDVYGVRSSTVSFEIFCPHPQCDFHELLPVQVVDEAIFENPPSMVVATVDKFARLAWSEKGRSLFGLGGSTHEGPSLVIQDELHLISGPLGTVVGAYEAALRGLMTWGGSLPKVVASTATIRAASEQIENLMGARVAVFPPSGLDADDNYFSEPDTEQPGRLYLGLMPQAHTPSWALAQIGTELLQAPVSVGLQDEYLDAYWTLVVYHNSLRELGRTMTILRDDVRSALERRRLADEGARKMARDGIDELNGNVSAEDLLAILDRLAQGPSEKSGDPLDALATTNIMSVGIDVPRLGLMLVNGQPKTTSEYIQATSRVGRGKVPGLVVTVFRSGKPRDRSVFESFRGYHQSYYREVEPASVTPWSLQARRRALRAALVILVRHGAGLTGNDDAKRFDPASAGVRRAVQVLLDHVAKSDPREAAAVQVELDKAVADWAYRVDAADSSGGVLRYRSKNPEERLLKQFADGGAGWSTMNSMRSVDRTVRVRADGERR